MDRRRIATIHASSDRKGSRSEFGDDTGGAALWLIDDEVGACAGPNTDDGVTVSHANGQ